MDYTAQDGIQTLTLGKALCQYDWPIHHMTKAQERSHTLVCDYV